MRAFRQLSLVGIAGLALAACSSGVSALDAGPDSGPDAGLDSGFDAGPGDAGDAGDAGPGDVADAGRNGGDAGPPPTCLIFGQLQSASAVNPSNPCELCDPVLSTTAWSVEPNGEACGAGELCFSGSCAALCDIDGGVYDAGALQVGAPCEACQPAFSTLAWTALPNGASCGSQLICTDGTCLAGCDVDGLVVDAGTIDAQNACETCAPAQSTTAWTPVADGSACGTGAFCAQGVCTDGCVADGGGASCGCASGVQTCGGALIDTCVADLHCGDCQTACFAPNGCFGGVCTIPGVMPTARDQLAAVLGADGRIYAIGGSDTPGNPLGTVEVYDPRSNAWAAAPSLLNPRYGLSAAVDSTGTIYALLGFELSGGTIYLVDWAESLAPGGSWVEIAQPPDFQGDTAAAVGPGGVFYLPGGETGQGISSDVYSYDPVSQVWANGPSLPSVTFAPGVSAGSDGTLYVLGGSVNDTSASAAIVSLAPGASAWVSAGQMLVARCEPGAATDLVGNLYTIGGQNCGVGNSTMGYALSDVVESFDPDAGLSSLRAPLPNAAQQAACVTGRDGRIYCLGGWDGFQAQNFLQVYDPIGDAWVP